MPARNALTCMVVMKEAEIVVPPPAYITAARTPSAPASAQETAVIFRVSTPISSAVNSFEAVTRTPRPHLLYLSRMKSAPSTTTLMARQMSACFVMMTLPPKAGMEILGETPASTVL